MVEGLESIGKNLVARVRDVYVFLGSFTYIMDFVKLEDIEESILRDMAEVLMGISFRKVTKLEYDWAKGLMSFTRINLSKYLVIFLHLVLTAALCSSSLNLESAALTNRISLYQQQSFNSALCVSIGISSWLVSSNCRIRLSDGYHPLIYGKTIPPWNLADLVSDIRSWSTNLQLSFSWTKRDNYKVAH
uniref:MAK10-like protein n=1 Tax=Tanacetum cinerariifolium TaxID=118510 RepID=A0A699J5D7_TANCI|nr:MAK10-like protein [Tanacetum cinerariifolium]